MSLIDVCQTVPGGFRDKTGEFYTDKDNSDICLSYNGQQYTYDNFPAYILKVVHDDMAENPIAMESLVEDMGLTDLKSQTRQYLACRHGSFDMTPDISEDGKLTPAEYVNCGRRGQCKAEGKVCPALKVKYGYLNANEIITLTHIGNGLIDKEIEDVTGFSVHTIRNHKDSTSRKTGLERKPLLCRLAFELGLVKKLELR